MSKTILNRRAFIIGLASAGFCTPAFAQTSNTGFIFVGASWCNFCHRAAPVLSMVAARYDIPVIVASHDNRPIEPFPKFMNAKDNAMSAGITRFPTTLVYSRSDNAVVAQIDGYREPQAYMVQLISAIEAVEGR